MNLRLILGIVFIVAFTSLLMVNLSQSIDTYVDFETAEERVDQRSYVVGNWVPEEPHGFNMDNMTFNFHMKDQSGNIRRVQYNRAKPQNFEDAEQIVVMGIMRNGVFYSDDMLVKCPSKYNDASEFTAAEH